MGSLQFCNTSFGCNLIREVSPFPTLAKFVAGAVQVLLQSHPRSPPLSYRSLGAKRRNPTTPLQSHPRSQPLSYLAELLLALHPCLVAISSEKPAPFLRYE